MHVKERHVRALVLLNVFRSKPPAAPVGFWSLKQFPKRVPRSVHVLEVHYGVIIFVFFSATKCIAAEGAAAHPYQAAVVQVQVAPAKYLGHPSHQPLFLGATLDENARCPNIFGTRDARHIVHGLDAVVLVRPAVEIHRPICVIAPQFARSASVLIWHRRGRWVAGLVCIVCARACNSFHIVLIN